MHAEQMSNICDFISETEKYLKETKIPLKLRPEIREEESFYFDGGLDEIIRKLSKIHHQLERFKIYLVNFEHLPDKDDDKKLLKNVYSKSSEVVALLGIMEKIHKINRYDVLIRRYNLKEESFQKSKDDVLSKLENSRLVDLPNVATSIKYLNLPNFDRFLTKISICYQPLAIVPKEEVFTLLSKNSIQDDFSDVLGPIFPGIESLDCQEMSTSSENIQRVSAVLTSDGARIPVHSIFLQKNLQLDVFCAKLESQIKIGSHEIFKTGLKRLVEDQAQVYSHEFWNRLNPPALIGIVLIEVFSKIYPLETMKLKSLKQDLEGQSVNLQILSAEIEYLMNFPENQSRFSLEVVPERSLLKGIAENVLEGDVFINQERFEWWPVAIKVGIQNNFPMLKSDFTVKVVVILNDYKIATSGSSSNPNYSVRRSKRALSGPARQTTAKNATGPFLRQRNGARSSSPSWSKIAPG